MFLVCGQLTYSGDVDFLQPSMLPAPAAHTHAPTSHINTLVLPETLILINSASLSNCDGCALMN